MISNNKSITLLLLILTVGFFLRIVGLNWDQDQHLHPDERFMTMVTDKIVWPGSLMEYFNTRTSTANPHNIGFPFFVYGTFPLFLIKAISQVFNQDNYIYITLIGRFISAVMDSFNILLIYLIISRLTKRIVPSILGAFIYATSVLPIQLSHYFATDTHLVFFQVLTFYFLLKRKPVLAGLAFGLALSSKITAVFLLPLILITLIYQHLKHKNLKSFVISGILILLFSGFTFRVFQPYLFDGVFSLNQLVINNWKQLKAFDDPTGWFPPAVQWIKSIPVIFPLENIFYWGLGPILSLLALYSIVKSILNFKKEPILMFISLWIIGIFLYQSFSFAKPMRYFYPLYPLVSVISGVALYDLILKSKHKLAVGIFCVLNLIWPFSFISIYLQPHTRVQATYWIYNNIPENSIISCEYWDDCLPLGGGLGYRFIELDLYKQADTEAKMIDIYKRLSRIDYLVLSSNRLYGSIMTVPEMYPNTTKFYNDLFAGNLGFVKVSEFTSRPTFPVPGLRLCLAPMFINYGKVAHKDQQCTSTGISFVDDYADESLTVYDHPKVIIFKKITSVL